MKIIKLLSWLLLSSLGFPALASDYRIELLVFTQEAVNSEQFTQKQRTLSLPDNLLEILPASSSDQTTLVEIPLNGLNRIAEKLVQQPSYRILFQKAWKQKFTFGAPTPSIHVHDTNGDLEGYINLLDEGSIKAKLDVEYVVENTGGQVYRLTDRRKLRSGEAQYVDHPKFGVIVLATNLAPPPPKPTPTPTPDPLTGIVPAPVTPVAPAVPVPPKNSVPAPTPLTPAAPAH